MRIAVLLLEDFPGSENRLQRQLRSLISSGHELKVFCARGGSTETTWNGVSISRSLTRRKKASSFGRRLFEYTAFPIEAAVWMLRVSLQWRPSVVQVANMPDWLIFSAAPARWLARARLVLDLHDLMPELLTSKGTAVGLRRALETVERASARFADVVLATSPGFAQTLAQRTGVNAKLVPNGVDSLLFPWVTATEQEYRSRPQRVVYHGTLAKRFGVATLVEALAILHERHGRVVETDIYGDGAELQALKERAAALGLATHVRFHGQVRAAELPSLLSGARIGVVPYLDDEFMSFAYSTKAFEYAALGIPVIASDIRSLREQLGDGAIYFAAGDPDSLARALDTALREERRCLELIRKAQDHTQPYAWERWAPSYIAAVTGNTLDEQRRGPVSGVHEP